MSTDVQITIDAQINDDITIGIPIADRPQVSPHIEAAQKEMFRVAAPTVTVSGVGILDFLREKRPAHGNHSLLWHVYVCSVSATFIFGSALLLLSLILPQVPRLVPAVKKLLWIAMILLHIALILKVGTHSIP